MALLNDSWIGQYLMYHVERNSPLVFLVLIFSTEELKCYNQGLIIERNTALTTACQLFFERKHPSLHGREFSHASQSNDFTSKR